MSDPTESLQDHSPVDFCKEKLMRILAEITIMACLTGLSEEEMYVNGRAGLLKSHMHLTQYVDQVCIICSSVKVTLCPPTSSVDGVCTCTTPSTHISVDLVIVL